MKKTLFLHIGTNKTGTSAIQRFFNTHREVLRQSGLLYPITGCVGEAHYGLSTVLGFGQGKCVAQSPGMGGWEKMRGSLAAEVEECGCRTIIVSSENFVLPKKTAPVREFFSDYDVHVIAYLRRHDAWWESAYNQAVKMVAKPAWETGFQGYLRFQRKQNPQYGNYRLLIERWGDAFGDDRVVVRPYEAQQNTPHIVVDFLRAIGCDSQVLPSPPPERVNASLTAENLFLIDAVQRADIPPTLRKRVIDHVVSQASGRGEGSLVPPGLRRRLVEENSDDYAWIARNYLHRADGQLFYDPLPDPGEPWSKPTGPAPRHIVEVMAKILASDATAPSNGSDVIPETQCTPLSEMPSGRVQQLGNWVRRVLVR